MHHRLRPRPAACLIMALALLATGCETVPYTGRSQLQLLSPSQESEMGVQAYQQILGQSHASADTAATGMITRVGSRIAAVTGRPEYKWEYRLIQDDKQANAFALPGGKVAVYTGILPITRDEAGLAVVLGHEVSHVMARHSAERISEQLSLQLGAQMVGSALGLDPEVTKVGAGLLVSALLLPWGRSQESEADHLGLIYMAKAGYDPHAARDLWIRMAEASKGRSRPPEFLSTHPSEEARVRQIEGWLPEAMRHYQPRR